MWRFHVITGVLAVVVGVGLVAGCEQEAARSADAGDGDAAAVVTTATVELVADAQAALDQILVSYLAVGERLAADEFEGVVAELATLHDAAHDLGGSDAPGIADAAHAVASPVHHVPEDLDEARELFAALSEAVIALTELAPPSDAAAPTLYRGQCPMVEADWLQTEERVVNPYMGKSMLRCGTVEPAAGTVERG
ncbi:MAG: hypothetical protein WD009_10915 [Phycisphaeraceae bacterium]